MYYNVQCKNTVQQYNVQCKLYTLDCVLCSVYCLHIALPC